MPVVRLLPGLPTRTDTGSIADADETDSVARAYNDASERESRRLAYGRAYRQNTGLILDELRAAGLGKAQTPKVQRPTRTVLEELSAREDRGLAILRMREDRDLARQRLSPSGLSYPAQMVMGRAREMVVAKGLRSALHVNLKVFVESVPRRGFMEAGWSKDGVRRRHAGRYKVLALDLPYVRFNGSMWRILRIDLDHEFRSIDALKQRLIDLGLGACLPHYATWDDVGHGIVPRPHLGWILPADAAVWNSPDPRCRQAPRRLFRSVHAAIVSLLRPVGADPGCLVQAHHGKNPVSPFLAVEAEWNTTHYPDLTQWRDLTRPDGERLLDMTMPMEAVVRTNVATIAGLDPEESNRFFSQAWIDAIDLLRKWKKDDDIRYTIGMDDRLTLTESLVAALCPAREAYGHASEIVLRSACRLVSERLRRRPHETLLHAVERGAASHLIDRAMNLKYRQAVGGAFAAATRADRVLERLAEAAESLFKDGETMPSAKRLAERSKVALSTVYRRRAEL